MTRGRECERTQRKERWGDGEANVQREKKDMESMYGIEEKKVGDAVTGKQN